MNNMIESNTDSIISWSYKITCDICKETKYLSNYAEVANYYKNNFIVKKINDVEYQDICCKCLQKEDE